MLTKTCGAAVCGIDAIRVNVEVSVDHGMGFFIVGLPDTAVKESIQRVTTALKQWRISVPAEHSVVVNMSPASVKKIGSSYDLTIAVGLASALGVVPSENLSRFMVMGELALDGSILPIPGALPIAIEARRLGLAGLIVPQENATEAAVVNNLNVYGMKNLGEVMAFFKGERVPEPVFVDTRREFEASQEFCDFDFSEVKGQQNVKRAFEVACAGGHNILLIGSPGSGKSMMAKRLPSILPPLTLAEALETTKIHSVAGKLPAGSRLLTRRPFRSPHHTISPVA